MSCTTPPPSTSCGSWSPAATGSARWAPGPERVRELWVHLPAFAALARTADPTGKFRNAMLDAYLPH